MQLLNVPPGKEYNQTTEILDALSGTTLEGGSDTVKVMVSISYKRFLMNSRES